jgi:hypothetical protein
VAVGGSAVESTGGLQYPAFRIKIDVLNGAIYNLEKPTDSRVTAAELVDIGSQGLEVTIAESHLYLLPAELIYSGVAASSGSETAEEFLGRAMSLLGLEPDRWKSRDVTLRAFRTLSFIEDASHTRALRILRGFAAVDGRDRDALLRAARDGGDYLVRMQKADGSFYYWYHALSDQQEGGPYNIVRHAGAAVSLFDLYRVTGDARYLAAARKATSFLRSRFRHFAGTQPTGRDSEKPEVGASPVAKVSSAKADRLKAELRTGHLTRGTSGLQSTADPDRLKAELRTGHWTGRSVGLESRPLYVLDDDNKAKLGAGGLALLAVTREMELDRRSDSKEANGLAAGILAMQRSDGSFETDLRLSGDESEAPPSLYYPGEAMLGLVRLYLLTGDRRLLDCARRGGDYLVGMQRKQRELPPDAWLVQSLESLYEITKDPRYAEHAIDLAASMAASLYPADGPEGYEGAVAPGIPRVTPAASRTEGLLAGYRVARSIKDPREERLLAAARAAAGFELTQQFGPDNSFFLPNPGRAAGGFHESVDSMRIRIDYVQHNISSLLGLAQAGKQ